jgi:large subunit ribosomal protein L18
LEETLVAVDSSYRVHFRRRREGKTDYRARKALVISGKPRLVVRASLKSMVVQVVAAKPQGDEVLVSAHSNELAKDYKWKAPAGNISAAYLTGYLGGMKTKASSIEEVNLDIGLSAPSKGARIFAALKGVLDAGVNVPYSEEKLPDEKRLQGEHVAVYAKSLASSPEKYQALFSKYLKQELSPEDLPEHFAEVKKAIAASFKHGGKKA